MLTIVLMVHRGSLRIWH